MKKLFSFIMVALMSIMTLNAETTRIYCKMAQNWWKVDNAAVGCHSWGTPGPGTTWPGVRMTPVENETDMWYIDLDVTKVQNVIFTRVNPSGNIADWGAKTKDLTIPTDGKNLFTITTTEAVWGNPGCDGEWSVYGGAVEKPKHDYTITAYLPEFCAEIEKYADSVRVMGGFDDWSNGIWMEMLWDEDFNTFWHAEIKDVEEGTEFKLRFGKDADWKVQVQLNGANMANEAFGETTDIVLHYDGEGYGFAACAAPAARKEFVFVADEAAEANPALFAITWGKDGSNETVKLANKADDIYTAEILETVDSVVLVRCASDATEIIWDGEGKNVWNQTANYELCDTMSFVAWVEETNLFAVTCEAPKPVETKYYAKNNWNNGDWSWLEMTKVEDLYVLDSVIFGGTGVNINTKEEDTDALWFDLKKMKYNEQDTIQALDTVRFELAISKEDTVLTAIKLGRPAPAARKEFVFVAGEAAEANPALFAITWGKDGSNETVKLANKADDIYTAEILETVDSVVLVRCATGATEIIWDGEGKNVWNQTANYALCDTMYFESWVEETNLFTITCDTPKPVETKYYAKNNWNNGDWSWLEMTKVEDLYVLDSVIFGGTGVNINTKEEDTDALWFDLKKMKYNEQDTIQALDTVRFELAISKEDTILTAIKLGRPAAAARKEFVFVAGEAAEANPALFAITWGKDGSNETVKLANKADDIYTAEILETVDSVVLVRCATGATEIIWDGEGKNVWNQTANYALCDTMSFVAWVEDTNLFTITCDTPKPVGEKYYITGNAALVGEEKAWSAQAIEMTDGAYTFTALPAGEYEMKITNGAWEPEGQSWGSAALSEECSAGVGDKEGNIHFIVETPNDVNVAIAEGKVTVIGTFKEEPVGTGITVNVTVPVGTPACYFYGEMSGNLFAEMTKLDDTHYTITFPHATSIGWGYLFVWENGNWNTKNADPEGDIKVEPVEGVIDIEIKAWVTNPGTEYKYTTYTEWQVKFGPAWEWVDMTKQEEGVFAVNAVWGTTTGMNIASGENPIKQDWYPLGDAALTVEEDVAEGDNVVITLTVVDDETVALNVAKGEGPTPAEEGFGIIVNGTEKIKGQKNEEQVEFLEYMIEANLTAGATFQLYDFANDAPWTEANIDEASTKNVTINANNLYEAAATGKYTIYLKMFGLGNNQVYIAFTSDPTGLIEIMRNAKDGKFIINGKMIIRRNGALYTIQGARL